MNQQSEKAGSRKRPHSSSDSSSKNPISTTSSDSSFSPIKNVQTRKKQNLLNHLKNSNSSYSSPDSSSAESNNNPTTSFYSSTIMPPKLTAQRSVPAFLNKLYNMVEDVSTNELIRWSKDGISFIVEKHEEFAKTVLPRFYKHNTFASFVRQLNMYDFHKVPHIQQGVLIAENEHDIWEFSNPHFQRSRPDLLILVTRKRNKERDILDTDNISGLAQDINLIKKHQSSISNDLKELHRNNDILWQETLVSREKHQRHQEAIEKILQFLTSIFSNDNLAITLNNPDLLPKKLIEEAASIAGMPIHKLNSETVKVPTNPVEATSTLSDILSSAIKLHSSNSSKINSNQPNLVKDSTITLPDSLNNAIDHSDPTTTLNTATKSAQLITQDINLLQLNIESLANNLGIDPNQLDDDLQGDFQFMNSNDGEYSFNENHHYPQHIQLKQENIMNIGDDDDEEEYEEDEEDGDENNNNSNVHSLYSSQYQNNSNQLKFKSINTFNMNHKSQSKLAENAQLANKPSFQSNISNIQSRPNQNKSMNLQMYSTKLNHDYRRYLSTTFQQEFKANQSMSSRPSNFYDIDNNQSESSQLNNNDNVMNNPYAIPYYNNRSNEENNKDG